MSDVFLKSRDIKRVKKPHNCIGCLTKIPVGSPASYNVSIYEGDFNTSYLCVYCNEYMKSSIITEFSEGEFLEDPQYTKFLRTKIEGL